MKRSHGVSGMILGVLVVGTLLAASGQASAYLETTWREWWNDTKNFDGIYGVELENAWLNFDVTNPGPSHNQYQNGIWGNGDAYHTLELELTSNAGSHEFGWYSRTSYTDTGAVGALHTIFTGADLQGKVVQVAMPDHWGFYYKVGSTYYSDWQLNGSNDNAYRVEVFRDPTWASGFGWCLGWEDGAIPNNMGTHLAFEDPNNNGDYSDMGSYAWESEPDFQDLIISFRRADEYGYTPPSTPEPATWVLLLATGALGAIRRRRRS